MNRLPDFLIIGAQKSAKTWLAHVLRQHPRIFMPEHEPHFFNYPQPIERYLQAFSQAHPDQLIGEKTPDYLHLSRRQIAEVRKLLPHARLIVILRNPIARAWSQARMELSVVNKRQLSQRDLLGLALHVYFARNRLRTKYAQALRRWLKFFPKEQLLVLFYEDLRKDPVDVLQRVFAFLNISPLPRPQLESLVAQRVWASPEHTLPKTLRYALTKQYISQTLLLERMGWRVPSEWPRPEELQTLRTGKPWLPLAASMLTGCMTLLTLPERSLVYIGRCFPSLRLYRFYDRLQHWRFLRLGFSRK